MCSCGRFATVKGFDLAVKAAEILNKHNLDFVWYFVGDGPERQHLEKMISDRRLEERVLITGMQKNPYPYMAACDIYVQPSHEESWGLTIVEAQQLLKPVVSTATVGGKKLISDGVNGVICQISAEAIAEAVKNLITDNELRVKITENLKNCDKVSDAYAFKTQWRNILEG